MIVGVKFQPLPVFNRVTKVVIIRKGDRGDYQKYSIKRAYPRVNSVESPPPVFHKVKKVKLVMVLRGVT